MAGVALFYSVHNPGIELDLLIILQSRAHSNGSDTARDTSVNPLALEIVLLFVAHHLCKM